jgi:hypothetical protein
VVMRTERCRVFPGHDAAPGPGASPLWLAQNATANRISRATAASSASGQALLGKSRVARTFCARMLATRARHARIPRNATSKHLPGRAGSTATSLVLVLGQRLQQPRGHGLVGIGVGDQRAGLVRYRQRSCSGSAANKATRCSRNWNPERRRSAAPRFRAPAHRWSARARRAGRRAAGQHEY